MSAEATRRNRFIATRERHAAGKIGRSTRVRAACCCATSLGCMQTSRPSKRVARWSWATMQRMRSSGSRCDDSPYVPKAIIHQCSSLDAPRVLGALRSRSPRRRHILVHVRGARSALSSSLAGRIYHHRRLCTCCNFESTLSPSIHTSPSTLCSLIRTVSTPRDPPAVRA